MWSPVECDQEDQFNVIRMQTRPRRPWAKKKKVRPRKNSYEKKRGCVGVYTFFFSSLVIVDDQEKRKLRICFFEVEPLLLFLLVTIPGLRVEPQAGNFFWLKRSPGSTSSRKRTGQAHLGLAQILSVRGAQGEKAFSRVVST
jgi:hypothetical protein